MINGKGLVGGPREEAPGAGNKAIALKLCRDVTIHDLTILNGGSLAILPTGVDDLRVDNLIIDTYSDGINVDCCRNVLISGCTINTPNADAIVLKSSYALNEARVTERVIIDDCRVSGYDLGTRYDGTRRTEAPHQRIGRIKFGTVEMSIFLRLGAPLSGPPGTTVGRLRRISISDVIIDDADPCYPSTIAGIPGHPIEDIRLRNIRQTVTGGLTPGDVVQDPPEHEDVYPETDMFGPLPAYGFFLRHAEGIELDHVDVGFHDHDTRPAYVLRDVDDFTITGSRPVPDTHIDHTDHQEL